MTRRATAFDQGVLLADRLVAVAVEYGASYAAITAEDVLLSPALLADAPSEWIFSEFYMNATALPERDWGTRRSEMIATARKIRDEDAYVGLGAVPGWYRTDADHDRDLACTVFTLTPDESRALIRWSKASGATVHGALSSA